MVNELTLKMITRIPIMTCRTCKRQFAKSRRITMPDGTKIVRFETRAKYCSGACCAKAYRLRKAESYASLTPQAASLTAS